MFDELVKSVLVAVIGFVLKLVFATTGVEIDDAIFNTILAGIVTYFLTLLGYAGARKAAPRAFRVDKEG